MIEIVVLGYLALALEHLVLDFNGTLACRREPTPLSTRRLFMYDEAERVLVARGPTGAVSLRGRGDGP